MNSLHIGDLTFAASPDPRNPEAMKYDLKSLSVNKINLVIISIYTGDTKNLYHRIF